MTSLCSHQILSLTSDNPGCLHQMQWVESCGYCRACHQHTNPADRSIQFYAELHKITDAWFADEISYAAMCERHRAMWDEIETAGPAVKEDVLRRLRDDFKAKAVR